jgi:ADP-heptose:LPS heptosyltransferase
MAESNPPERIIKLAEKIQKEAKEQSTPVPKMRIPKMYDIESGLGIGDIMVLLTLLPALKREHPGWTIRLITEKKDWASLGHDYVISKDDFEAAGTRGEKYFKQFEEDWIYYDLEAIGKKKLRHELFGERLGVNPEPAILRVTDDAMYWAKQIIDNKDNLKVVGIAPYSSSEQRTWPDENWVLLIEKLIAAGYFPLMIGGPGEGERSKFYPCMRYWGMGAQRTTALLAQCALVIGNDSGMAHVAGTLRRPTIVIGAPSDTPRIFGWYGSVRCLQAHSECGMCYWRRDRGFRQECNYRCRLIGTISPPDVFKEAKRILDANDGKRL